MVARYAGAALGLLAFTITIIAGLLAENPFGVTLSRSLLALILFCVLGLVLGAAAQMVIAEYETSRRAAIRQQYGREPAEAVDGGSPQTLDDDGGVAKGS